ncbi:hypothetical protein Hdeb2414_s0012g00390531 [Helianthus debilis subsp. tardiflorus]
MTLNAYKTLCGFSFVVFVDLDVLDRVIKEKYHIDGQMVEANKVVPREDQSTISGNSGIAFRVSGPNRTRK